MLHCELHIEHVKTKSVIYIMNYAPLEKPRLISHPTYFLPLSIPFTDYLDFCP
jgi:hypothetical protein